MNNFVEEIKRRLAEAESRQIKSETLKGLSIFVLIFSIFVLFVSLLENIAFFGTGIRAVFFYGSIAVILSLLFFFIVLPFLKSVFIFSKPEYFKTANSVGNKFTDIKDNLLNSLQLISENSSQYSAQLVNAAFEKVYDKSKGYNFNEIVDYSSAKKQFRNSSIVFTAVIMLFLIVPGLGSSANRILSYNTNFTPPPKFVFEIIPGNAEYTKGDNVTIKIQTVGEHPNKIDLASKSEEQTEFVSHKLSADSLGNFTYEAASVKSSFEYFASAEGIESDVYKISVINRPIITTYDLSIIPPAYTKLPSTNQRDNGNITALPGSRVKLKLYSSRELSKSTLSFGDSTLKSMSVNNESASCDFTIYMDNSYQMLIRDKQGFGNTNPISYSIKVLADAPPSIEMISPNENINLGTETKIALTSKIKDDYGFTKMNLNYRLSASKYRQVADEFTQIPVTIKKDSKEDDVYYVWDLAPMVLAEGEMLSYYLEVFDNDNVKGPKSARTQLFTINVPSLDNLFAGAENTQQEATKDLAETLQEAEKLRQEMQKISDDLKQNNREISWQEKERIEKAAENYKDLMGKVDDISQKLSDMKKDLAQNNLLSEETLQKYNELQKLLDEMTSDEMKQALQRMQDALKNLMRDQAQMSLEELKANENNFKASLERTINLLKRIQIEQKIDELVKRTDDLTEKLNDLNEKTNQSNLSDKQKQDELANRQKDASQEMQNLQDEMNNLQNKMEGMKDMPKDQLEKAMKEFEKQQNQKLSDEALKNLREMQKMEAMKNQQQLSQNMQSMNKQFQDLQSAMQQMNQVQTYYDMMKILNDLVGLSKSQEELKNNTDDAGVNSKQLQQNSRDQSELQNDLNKVLQNMSALSQKSFAITPEMGKQLGSAYSKMQQAITMMQNNGGSAAAALQKQAMESLNNAADLVKGGMDQMMQGGQGGGMMSLMQQLQQLSQQQMNLNQLTQMMNQGQLTPEMASQMQRLAQQQEMIRKSLEQMNKEAKETGQSKRLAANLEKITEDMKEVVTNLQTEKLNDDLIKQQERILSRLLDAQRSVNERDYEKNRESNTGRNVARNTPPELILNTEEGKNKLKEELLKAIREGYSQDYEDLIRKYFEALQNQK